MAQDTDQKQYHTGGWSAHFIMIVCMLLFVVNYMDRQVFSAVLQPMKIDLGLTDAQAGGVATAFTLGMAIFSFPIAWMVDRWSRNKTIGIMALLWSLFTFLTGFARSFTTLIMPRSLVGVGESGFTAGGVAIGAAAAGGAGRTTSPSCFTKTTDGERGGERNTTNTERVASASMRGP